MLLLFPMLFWSLLVLILVQAETKKALEKVVAKMNLAEKKHGKSTTHTCSIARLFQPKTVKKITQISEKLPKSQFIPNTKLCYLF